MHPKLVDIWIENSRETHWNQNEHAVYLRETLKRNPCYTIIAPCDIKLPDGVLAVTPLEIESYCPCMMRFGGGFCKSQVTLKFWLGID